MDNCVGSVKIKKDIIIITKYNGEVEIWSIKSKDTSNYIIHNGFTYYLTNNINDEDEDEDLNNDY
jgi:hypothetical protein